MSSYTEQLEKQNEELQERLAVAEKRANMYDHICKSNHTHFIFVKCDGGRMFFAAGDTMKEINDIMEHNKL